MDKCQCLSVEHIDGGSLPGKSGSTFLGSSVAGPGAMGGLGLDLAPLKQYNAQYTLNLQLLTYYMYWHNVIASCVTCYQIVQQS